MPEKSFMAYLHGIHYAYLHYRYMETLMRIESEIKRWGNSLALRITGAMAEVPKFTDGTKVTVEITEDALIIKRAAKSRRVLNLPYTEHDLLNGMNPTKAHADELAVPSKKELGI